MEVLIGRDWCRPALLHPDGDGDGDGGGAGYARRAVNKLTVRSSKFSICCKSSCLSCSSTHAVAVAYADLGSRGGRRGRGREGGGGGAGGGGGGGECQQIIKPPSPTYTNARSVHLRQYTDRNYGIWKLHLHQIPDGRMCSCPALFSVPLRTCFCTA